MTTTLRILHAAQVLSLIGAAVWWIAGAISLLAGDGYAADVYSTLVGFGLVGDAVTAFLIAAIRHGTKPP